MLNTVWGGMGLRKSRLKEFFVMSRGTLSSTVRYPRFKNVGLIHPYTQDRSLKTYIFQNLTTMFH